MEAHALRLYHDVRDSDTVRPPDELGTQLLDLWWATGGTRIAIRAGMTSDLVSELLADIHRSLDRLADDLSRDRPDLASALRKEAAWIPPPDRATQARPAPTPTRACCALGPLLYRALDEGLLPHRRFDALMIRRVRVAGVLRSRAR